MTRQFHASLSNTNTSTISSTTTPSSSIKSHATTTTTTITSLDKSTKITSKTLAYAVTLNLDSGIGRTFRFSTSLKSHSKWEIVPTTCGVTTTMTLPNPNTSIKFAKEINEAIVTSTTGNITESFTKNPIFENDLVCISVCCDGGGNEEGMWMGYIVNNTMFVKVPGSGGGKENFGGGFHGREMKDVIVSLLELAEEVFGCDNLVVCVDKQLDGFGSLVRNFMFVGFEMVHPAVIQVPSYLLLGYQLG